MPRIPHRLKVSSHVEVSCGVDRREVVVHCSLSVVEHDERNDKLLPDVDLFNAGARLPFR